MDYKEVYEYTEFGSKHLVMKTIDYDDFQHKNWYGVDIFDEEYDRVIELEVTSKLSDAKKVYHKWKNNFEELIKREDEEE